MEHEKIVLTGIVNCESEDSGAALIAEIDSDIDENFFVRLHSYDESNLHIYNKTVSDHNNETHATMKKLEGKKVRVTVEVIE